MLALDGAWHEPGGELSWQGLGHLQTSEVGAVLESTVRRIERQLGRRGLLGIDAQRSPRSASSRAPTATLAEAYKYAADDGLGNLARQEAP